MPGGGGLTPAELEQYHTQGWLVKKDVFSSADLLPLQRALTRVLDQVTTHAADAPFDRRLGQIYQADQALGDECMGAVSGAMRRALLRAPLTCMLHLARTRDQTMSSPTSPHTPPHTHPPTHPHAFFCSQGRSGRPAGRWPRPCSECSGTHRSSRWCRTHVHSPCATAVGGGACCLPFSAVERA